MSLPKIDLQRTFFDPEILFPGLAQTPGAERFSFFLRWKLALGMEADEPAFHPTSLVKFRERLLAHGLEQLGFDAVLEQMSAAGYLAKRTKQRLDSTHIIGLVSHMTRLDCVRETLRLALEDLALEDLA